MIWLWFAIGLFVLLAAGMYVPDWVKWARWNSERKRLPENKRRRMRPAPVAAPFWSSYAGHTAIGGGPGMAGGVDCDPSDGVDAGGIGGFGDIGGGAEGGGDGGGGGCD